MKRILLSITGTALGLVALLSFKSNGHPVAGGALPAVALPPSSSPQTSHSVSAPPAPGTTKKKSTSAATATTKTVAGSAIQTQYGMVQVQVTVRISGSSKQITNAKFLQLTAYDGRSQEINNAAGPILLQETLAAQSARIDIVSGASYTSDGYQQSLQSALDQVGIR